MKTQDPAAGVPAGTELEAFAASLAAPRTTNPRSRTAWMTRRAELRQQLRERLALDLLRDAPPDLLSMELPAGSRPPGGHPAALLIGADRADESLDAALRAALAGRLAIAATGGRAPAGPDARAIEPGHRVAGALAAAGQLRKHPDIDGERIVVVSWGESVPVALLVAALDERVAAAIVAGPAGYLGPAARRGEPGLGDYPYGILRVCDRPELAAMIAPRPLLLLDEPAESSDPALGEILNVYGLYGLQDRVTAAGEAPGAGDRTAAVRGWISAALRLPLDPAAPAGALGDPAPGEFVPPGPSPPEPPRASSRTPLAERLFAQPPRLESRPARRSWQARLRGELKHLLADPAGEAALLPRLRPLGPAGPESAPGKVRGGDGDPAGAFVEAGTLQVEAGARVPVCLAMPGHGRCGVVVAALAASELDPPAEVAVYAAYLAAGLGVAIVGTRLHLEHEPGWQPLLRLAGRAPAAMAARDIIAAVDFLARRPDVDLRRIAVIGAGPAGISALLAAGWDERIAGVAADCGGSIYRDGGGGLPALPNLLLAADTPQLASLVAPRSLWLANVPAERTGFSSRRYFDWTRRMYQSLGGTLNLDCGPLPPHSAVSRWLLEQWRGRPPSAGPAPTGQKRRG